MGLIMLIEPFVSLLFSLYDIRYPQWLVHFTCDESYILINMTCLLVLSQSFYSYLAKESSPAMCRNPRRSLLSFPLRLQPPRFFHLRRITAAFARRPPALLNKRQLLVRNFSRCCRRLAFTNQRRIQSERLGVCSTFIYYFRPGSCCGFSFCFGLRGRRFCC